MFFFCAIPTAFFVVTSGLAADAQITANRNNAPSEQELLVFYSAIGTQNWRTIGGFVSPSITNGRKLYFHPSFLAAKGLRWKTITTHRILVAKGRDSLGQTQKGFMVIGLFYAQSSEAVSPKEDSSTGEPRNGPSGIVVRENFLVRTDVWVRVADRWQVIPCEEFHDHDLQLRTQEGYSVGQSFNSEGELLKAILEDTKVWQGLKE